MRSYCSTLDGFRTVAVRFFVVGLHSWRVSGGAALSGGFRTSRRYRACFERSDDCRATFRRFHPFEHPNLARRRSGCLEPAREHGWVSGTHPATLRCPELAWRRAGLGRAGPSRSAPGRESAQARILPGAGRARRSLASSVPSPSPVITERLPTDRVRPSQLAV